MSCTTRFTPSTSLMMRFDIRLSTSSGNGNQPDVGIQSDSSYPLEIDHIRLPQNIQRVH